MCPVFQQSWTFCSPTETSVDPAEPELSPECKAETTMFFCPPIYALTFSFRYEPPDHFQRRLRSTQSWSSLNPWDFLLSLLSSDRMLPIPLLSSQNSNPSPVILTYPKKNLDTFLSIAEEQKCKVSLLSLLTVFQKKEAVSDLSASQRVWSLILSKDQM